MTRAATAPLSADQPAPKPKSLAEKIIGDGALLGDARAVGRLCDLSDRTIWRMNSAELLPRPVRCGGSTKWVISEIVDWIAAGCPDRRRWEQLRRKAK